MKIEKNSKTEIVPMYLKKINKIKHNSIFLVYSTNDEIKI